MCFGVSIIIFSFELVRKYNDPRTHQTAVRTIKCRRAFWIGMEQLSEILRLNGMYAERTYRRIRGK